MFSISLRQADHVRHYSIAAGDPSGWVVKLEQDREPARVEHFADWHRVERKLDEVRLEVARLTARGWQIQSTKR